MGSGAILVSVCVSAVACVFFQDVKMRNKEKVRIYNKAYYQANADKAKAYQKAYYLIHSEKMKIRDKIYRQVNSEKRKVYNKAYYEANKKRLSEYNKARSKMFNKLHPEKVRIYNKKYRQEYLEKIRIQSKFWRQTHAKELKESRKQYHATHREKSRIYSRKRKALKRGVRHEPYTEKYIFNRDGWVCGLCGKLVNPKFKHPHLLSASIDHIIPLSKGGGDNTLNTQAAHLGCNISKNAKNMGQLRLFG